MPLLRLIGLTLFITAIFLAMVAAITQTTHIQIQLPWLSDSQTGAPRGGEPSRIEPRIDLQSGLLLPPGGSDQVPVAEVGFTSVPIIWPLIIAAGLGLLMWFTHPGEPLRVTRSAGKGRARRRR